jgi:ABC-2 type transport system ATP-binding protein
VLAFVDLADRESARIDDLSGGMIRRASLACALVHDPDVLVLDEPTVGLDPQLRASMWEGFRERRDHGTLVLVSTHYLGEVSRCDRVLFLRDGRVLDVDSPADFLDRTGTEDMEAAFLALLAEDGGERP